MKAGTPAAGTNCLPPEPPAELKLLPLQPMLRRVVTRVEVYAIVITFWAPSRAHPR